jgi:glycerophosphoryl diester phosphodiesterase
MNLFKTWLVERCIAHRGLHDNIAPENSIKAFHNAIDKNLPIEFDIQSISDGTIIVFMIQN